MSDEPKNTKVNYPMSFRFDSETKSILAELQQKFCISQAGVIRIAVRKLLDAEKAGSSKAA